MANPQPLTPPHNPLDKRNILVMTPRRRWIHDTTVRALRSMPRNSLGCWILVALGRMPPPVKPFFQQPKLDQATLTASNERLQRMRTAINAGASVEEAAEVSREAWDKLQPANESVIALPGTDVAEALTRGSDNKAFAESYKARRTSIQLPPGVERD
jgi:hypothetical protein